MACAADLAVAVWILQRVGSDRSDGIGGVKGALPLSGVEGAKKLWGTARSAACRRQLSLAGSGRRASSYGKRSTDLVPLSLSRGQAA